MWTLDLVISAKQHRLNMGTLSLPLWLQSPRNFDAVSHRSLRQFWVKFPCFWFVRVSQTFQFWLPRPTIHRWIWSVFNLFTRFTEQVERESISAGYTGTHIQLVFFRKISISFETELLVKISNSGMPIKCPLDNECWMKASKFEHDQPKLPFLVTVPQ